MQLYYEALLQFVEFSSEQMSANKFNLYSFLINAHVSDKWLEKCQNFIYNSIFHRIDTDKFYEMPLVLLACKSMPLIKAFKTYIDQSFEANPFTKRTAFFMATNQCTHFFEPIIQDTHGIVESSIIRNISRLVKLAMLISNKPTRPSSDFNFYDEVWRLFEHIDAASLSDKQKILYNEFARMLSLHHFVRTNRRYEYLSDSIAIKVLASKYNILEFFVKFNEGSMIMNKSDYLLVRKQLVENGIFNQSINPNIQKDGAKASEVNVYDQFYTIFIMFEMLLVRPTTRHYVDIVHKSSTEVKQIIDNIDDSFDYIETVEYLFTLLFLRWEHVSSKVFSHGRLVNTSTSITNESDTTAEHNNGAPKKYAAKLNAKNGFVCSIFVLQNMLSTLSDSMANRNTDELNKLLKNRFDRITSAIDDAKWRFQLVDLFYSTTDCIRAPAELKLMLTSRYKQTASKKNFSSSDEEEVTLSVPKQLSSIRRKPRRQCSNKKSSRSSRSSCANSTEVEGKDKNGIGPVTNHRERRGFMAKIFGQLTDMVTISVIRGDLNAAKDIIEVS